MNDVHLYGHIVRDPEVRSVTANGRETKVANFTVATTRHFKKRDGENNSETTFVPCEVWDTAASSMEKIIKKGDPILVKGSLKIETWEKDGEKRSKMKVRVDKFQKLYRAPKAENNVDSNVESKVESSEEPVAVGDNIPF